MRGVSEAQEAVLALCLQHPEAFRRASLQATREHFDGEHRAIWSAMQRVGEPLEPASLVDELTPNPNNRQKTLARVSALRFYAADKNNLPALLGQLDSAYRYRQLIGSLQRSLAEVQGSKAEYAIIAAKVEQDILATTRATGGGHFISASEALTEAYVEAMRAAESGGFAGYRTGLGPLDRLSNGFGFGHVTTIMGEPGVGKTALMLQTAAHIARAAPVALVSLEMTPADLMQRLQACLSGVEYARIQGGKLQADQQGRLDGADEIITALKLHIAPAHVQTFGEALAFFRWMYFEHGCKLFYLDNILSLDYENRTEYEHITYVANGAQRFAKELQIALVNLHHTNTSERPDLRNTHGAKAIARHSSNVLALYQPDPTYSRIEFIELKGRNSGKGSFDLVFEGAYQRFRGGMVGL